MKILFGGKHRSAVRTRMPKGIRYGGGIAPAGRLWDKIEELPDGTPIYADVNYGMWGYFEIGGQWWKFPLFPESRGRHLRA